jgi:hypothetical protein
MYSSVPVLAPIAEPFGGDGQTVIWLDYCESNEFVGRGAIKFPRTRYETGNFG